MMMIIRGSSTSIATLVVLATILLSGRGGALAFSTPPISHLLKFIQTESSTSCDTTTTYTTRLSASRDKNDDDSTISIDTMNRRNAIQRFAMAFISSTTAIPQLANAAGDPNLFKPNPLTNKALEQLRILNQDEVDNIKYGGELESGAAKPSELSQYIELLQPILEVESGLEQVDKLLLSSKSSTKEDYLSLFQQIDKLLSNSLFDKINFKKAFNAFADNIYYSDSDRANLYLGGGAEPTSTQSLAYLLRNDILTTVEDMRAEVKYLLKEVNKKANGETIVVGGDGLDIDEITGLSKTANVAMKKYLDLVPPSELAEARRKFAAK